METTKFKLRTISVPAGITVEVSFDSRWGIQTEHAILEDDYVSISTIFGVSPTVKEIIEIVELPEEEFFEEEILWEENFEEEEFFEDEILDEEEFFEEEILEEEVLEEEFEDEILKEEVLEDEEFFEEKFEEFEDLSVIENITYTDNILEDDEPAQG